MGSYLRLRLGILEYDTRFVVTRHYMDWLVALRYIAHIDNEYVLLYCTLL